MVSKKASKFFFNVIILNLVCIFGALSDAQEKPVLLDIPYVAPNQIEPENNLFFYDDVVRDAVPKTEEKLYNTPHYTYSAPEPREKTPHKALDWDGEQPQELFLGMFSYTSKTLDNPDQRKKPQNFAQEHNARQKYLEKQLLSRKG